MQFEPPTKPTDVAVSINAGSGDDGSSAGTDHNGLVTGRWKTGLFGFTDSLVPNGVMSFCCPAVSVAQIAARVGMMPFYHVLALFGGLYFLSFMAAVTESTFWSLLCWLAIIVSVLCHLRMRWRLRAIFAIPGSPVEDALVSLFCGCCSIAQMASHVESYEPGTFAFAPRETLQGYAFN
ncbi:hypothetical protein P43SY_004209 [Pythium insidiosum]|uniref:Transmembrane protein n=1 Tax=Pythium insidiosum TaxID=114742 RepID=A0AAD5LUN4_PYTIN|nr:hypothetical protein P43SY_004209 [Pythium insidiosum]